MPILTPSTVPSKGPTRTTLRAWARKRDLESWTHAIATGLLNAAAAVIAVQSAMRAGWVVALDRLWNAKVLPPAVFLATGWKDLRNGTWSGVPRPDGLLVEAWMDEKTWGPAQDALHQDAQIKGGVYALRSALDGDRPERWTRALNHGTPVRNAGGHRLLDSLLGQHLDTSADGRPLKGWRLTALFDLLDHRVPLDDDDLLAVFERGDDDLLSRCLTYALDDRSPGQCALLLARSGLLKKSGAQARRPERQEQWFKAMMAHGIVATLRFTAHEVARSPAFAGDGRLSVASMVGRMRSSRVPTLLSQKGNHEPQTLHVADYWWVEAFEASPGWQKVHENRHHLTMLVELPQLRAELRNAVQDGQEAVRARPRPRL